MHSANETSTPENRRKFKAGPVNGRNLTVSCKDKANFAHVGPGHVRGVSSVVGLSKGS